MVTGDELKKQFDLRSEGFNDSAGWVKDTALISTHADLAGTVKGRALDLCCGTGMIGRALKARGWTVTGLDISREMIKISSKYFEVAEGSAEQMPFGEGAFDAVVCRQTFQFLDTQKVLFEICRVLRPGGVFVLGLTVPFADQDRDWLCKIHMVKQPLLKKFYTEEGLREEILSSGFELLEDRHLRVRESIARWMKYAPELSPEIREKVISMVKEAPGPYRDIHRVCIEGDDVTEDWNWVVLKFSSKQGGR